MKRIGKTITIALTGMLLMSCSSDETLTYSLSVDKTVIESDGKDAATFTIRDSKGREMTDADNMKSTSFHIKETDVFQSGMTMKNPNVFSSIADGEYTIIAMYKGIECSNTVTVTSRNRRKYEMFHKNVAIYRLTATWCGYCPSMTEGLSGINDFTRSHSVILSFHNLDEFSIPYNTSADLAEALKKKFGISGIPYAIYSLEYGSSERKVSDIEKYVKSQLYDNPAKTGIKAKSEINGNTLTVEAEVKVSEKGEYDLGMAIIQDGCIPESASATESIYNNVVKGITGNFYMMSSDGTASIEAEKTKTWSFRYEKLPEETSGTAVVLFTLYRSDKGVIIDNIIEFKPGESIDYRYN